MTTFATNSNSAARRAIIILGAGHIGFAMALLLQQSDDCDILVADRDPARLAEVAALGISTRLTVDDASLQAAIDGRFAVLNALPFHRAVPVATLCASAGVHYFDLTEDVASTQAIRALAANARSVLMPQCGLRQASSASWATIWPGVLTPCTRCACAWGRCPATRRAPCATT